ncbi:MAG: integrase, partial [Campylobacterota bacterium]|nr:integrase [Campylobacterota bacterium]
MSLIASGMKSPNKGDKKVKDIKASILNRSDRKHWYIKYQLFFENGNVEKKEGSTKVLKTEKPLKYMQTQYLPAWISKKKNEMVVERHKSTLFSQYASIFLHDSENMHDYNNTRYRLKRILVDFGDFDIRKITKLDIKQWLNALIDKRSGQILSKNSKSKYLCVFNQVFERAHDDGAIMQKITSDLKLSTTGKRDLVSIEPFEKGEVNLLLQNSKSSIYGENLHYYLGIAFNQGMSPA